MTKGGPKPPCQINLLCHLRYFRKISDKKLFLNIKSMFMKTCSTLKIAAAFLVLCCTNLGFCQLEPNVYLYEEQTENTPIVHELKLDRGYMIYSKYKKQPAEFISTVGGYYSLENDTLNVKFEFNSDYEKNAMTKISLGYAAEGNDLMVNGNAFKAIPQQKQDLDGQWLFATRGPDTGQERRGEAQARKTLKFLLNGHFQWVAYHTETFRFSGTGGGTFSAKDGKYIENIGYFSRDNNRVGAELDFNYELKGNDWHHTGKNSKGAPMYEIWARRE